MLFIIGYFVVFTCMLYQVDGQFKVEPQDTVVSPGANATLHCTIDVNMYTLEQIDGYWTVDGVLYRPGWSSRYVISAPEDTGEFDMHVIGTQYAEDDKDYICAFHILQTETQQFSSPAHLYVLNAPQSITISKTPAGDLQEGDTVTLTCESLGGSPPPNITWYDPQFNAVPGTYNPGSQDVPSTSEITFEASWTDHENLYTCDVWNQANINNVLSDSESLIVFYYPRVSLNPTNPQKEINVERGALEIITATVNAYPEVTTLNWKLDGLFVFNGFEYSLNPVKEEHAGSYVVEATNSEGTGFDELDVAVLYGPTITTAQYFTIVEGADLQITCEYSANPAPTEVLWKNADGSIVSQTSVLQINNIQRSQAGNYTCEATNYVDVITDPGLRAGAGSTLVEVHFAPVPYGDEKFAAEVGSQATVICSAYTSPAPAFTWIHDESQLTNDTARISIFDHPGDGANVHESHLVIDVVEQNDYGLYNCLIVNNMGELETDLTLQDISAPDAPASLTSYNLTDQSVELQWVEGFDGGLPTTYTVYYTNIKSGLKLDIPEIVTSHYELSDLSPSTQYEIYVEAVNDRGASGSSNKILVTTELPSVDVTKIDLAPVTFSEVTKQLSWTSSSHDARVCVRVNTKLEDADWQHFGENCYDISRESVEIDSYEKNMQMSVQACLKEDIDTDSRICGAELIADIVFYIWMLIVIIVASILLVVLTIAIVFCCCYKKKPKEDKNSIAAERDYEMENANARPKTFSNHTPHPGYDNYGGHLDDVDHLHSNYNNSNNYYNNSIKQNGVLPPAYRDSSGSDIYKPDPWDADPYIIHVGDNDYYQNDHHNLHVSGLPDPYERDDYSSHSTGRAPSTTLTFVPNGGPGYDHNSVTSGQSTPITPTRKIIHEVVV